LAKDHKYYQKNPVEWIETFLNVRLWQRQAEIAQSVADNPKTSVRSAHAVGKSFVSACIVLWYLFNHYPSRVISTAPTFRQVRTVLWAEIANLHANLSTKLEFAGELFPATCVLRLTPKWFAMGFSTDKPGAIQGQHEGNQLVIFDEACEIKADIYTYAEGIITGEGNKVLLIGNPVTPNNYFHQTHTGDMPGFKTLKISAYESPNIEFDPITKEYRNVEPLPYPALVDLNWINDQIKKYGKSSPHVMARVFAEFPEAAEDQLITDQMLAAAVHKGVLLRRVLEHMDIGEEIVKSNMLGRRR
jgi:phage terminase large subunit